MKKSLSACLFVFLSSLLFAQKVEIVKKIPFGTEDSFNYWTKWDQNEESSPGVSILACDIKSMILCQGNSFFEYNIKKDVIEKKLENKHEGLLAGSLIYGYISNGYIYGNVRCGWEVFDDEFKIKIQNKEFSIQNEASIFNRVIFNSSSFYYTDNTVFFMTDTKDLVSIQLYEDGTYRTRGIEETKEYLENGKAEELGVIFNDIEDRFVFGEKSITGRGPYYWNISNNLKMNSPKYENRTRLKGTGYSTLGEDNKGLIYFRKLESSNGINKLQQPGRDIKFTIAVVDVWNKEVYFYEDYKVNEWNPPRDAEGKTLCSTSWTVAPDGNIYFTDCDLGNKEWLIKKIPNRWYEEIGINNRHIGRFTVNHVPLYVDASENSETNGFNFENDIIWEKETKGEWSRIQKLDGREGWVQTKYITFD